MDGSRFLQCTAVAAWSLAARERMCSKRLLTCRRSLSSVGCLDEYGRLLDRSFHEIGWRIGGPAHIWSRAIERSGGLRRRVRPHCPVAAPHAQAEVLGDQERHDTLELDPIAISVVGIDGGDHGVRKEVMVEAVEPDERQICNLGAELDTLMRHEFPGYADAERFPFGVLGNANDRDRARKCAHCIGIRDLLAAMS